MQKGDKADDVVVVEVKLVWRNKLQANSLCAHPTHNRAQHFWRGTSVEERGSVARQKDNRRALAWVTRQSP